MSRPDVVTIDFRKHPDTPHWHFSMYRLGVDGYGTWLWSPDGSMARRGTEPAITMRGRHVKLIPEDAWWTAIWAEDLPDVERPDLFIDIVTPPRWTGSVVTMTDLDLDIGRWDDGRVEVFDEDEFAEHRETLGYPDHLVDRARTTTAKLYLDVLNRTEPFDAVARRWMERALGREGPPL